MESTTRIISVTSYYSDNVTNMILVDSNGFKGESGSSFTGIAAEVSVKDDKGRPSDYWGEYSIFYDRLKKTGVGKTAFERAIRKSNPKKIRSGKYKIIVENLVSGNLLNPFISALLGSSIYQKNSFLQERSTPWSQAINSLSMMIPYDLGFRIKKFR